MAALPFVHYAVTSWFLHAEEAENRNAFHSDLIQAFEYPNGEYFPKWIELSLKIDEFSWFPNKLIKVITCFLQIKPPEYHQAPLRAGCECRRRRLIREQSGPLCCNNGEYRDLENLICCRC